MGDETTKQLQGCSDLLAARGESHTISKLKPKIRIVHIFAPKIIKTDEANFRELVQRLTGKPPRSKKEAGGGCRKKRATAVAQVAEPKLPGFCDVTAMGSFKEYWEAPTADLGNQRVKVEVEMAQEGLWRADNEGSFIGNLAADLDGFMQELGELPLIPLSASYVDLFGEETPSTSESDLSPGP